MVEGIVARLRDALGEGPGAVCVATGGLAATIANETLVIDHVNPDLTLHGLRRVWLGNGARDDGSDDRSSGLSD